MKEMRKLRSMRPKRVARHAPDSRLGAGIMPAGTARNNQATVRLKPSRPHAQCVKIE
jgi:hypothetical protein